MRIFTSSLKEKSMNIYIYIYIYIYTHIYTFLIKDTFIHAGLGSEQQTLSNYQAVSIRKLLKLLKFQHFTVETYR